MLKGMHASNINYRIMYKLGIIISSYTIHLSDKSMEAYYMLYPEKKQTEKVYCFFDEIQVIPGWEPGQSH